MSNNKQEIVVYHGTEYILLYKYDSGYCEIRTIDSLNEIKLVPYSELTFKK